jgi:hypothetical protein
MKSCEVTWDGALASSLTNIGPERQAALELPKGGWKANKNAEFLSVGPPKDRLYKQGPCRVCHVAVFGKLAVKKMTCGDARCERKFRENPHKYPEWKAQLEEDET